MKHVSQGSLAIQVEGSSTARAEGGGSILYFWVCEAIGQYST
jgi:hypothetical protein